MQQWRVSEQESKLTLASFLKQKLGEGFSLRKIKAFIDQGCAKINGKSERFANTLVGRGDTITFEERDVQAKSTNSFESKRILYQDEFLFAYDKQAGISSEDLFVLLKKEDPTLFEVHRLDKETTGVILLAKGKLNARKIEDLFRQRMIQKTYLAIVEGVPQVESGIIEATLKIKTEAHGHKIWEVDKTHQGLVAVTEWQLLSHTKDKSLIKCMPKTGRMHQIRVHLAFIGHPIVGDVSYGAKSQASRILLHASQLTFTHPISHKNIVIQSRTPKEISLLS